MAITVLASIFIVVILLIAAFGFRLVIKQGKPPEDLHSEQCSICREKFNKSLLVERQIGDYKVLYFCPSCITKLHSEMVSKN